MQCWCLCFSFLSFFVACAMNRGHLYCYSLCTVVVHARFLTRWPSSFAIVCALFLCREGRSLTQWPSSLLQFVHCSCAGKKISDTMTIFIAIVCSLFFCREDLCLRWNVSTSSKNTSTFETTYTTSNNENIQVQQNHVPTIGYLPTTTSPNVTLLFSEPNIDPTIHAPAISLAKKTMMNTMMNINSPPLMR